MDHGNPRREDYWSAWATHYAARGPRYEPFKQSTTGVTTTSLLVLDTDDNEIERSVREQIGADTKVFAFSHVLRTTGRELPVRKLCDVARAAKAEKNPNHPELFILVDGAQALGNLPRVDVAELGCDAYVATPHKTLRSEVVGILYLNPRSTLIRKNLSTLRSLDPRTQQVILGGMFDERTGVLPNVADALSPADVAGFSAAVRETRANGVEGNDFSRVHERRSALKQYCIERLTALAGESATEIHVLPVENPTSFILPIQIPSKNGKEIARALSDKGMFLSYIEGEPTRTNKRLIRISFQADHTERDVDALIDALRDILAQ